MLPDRIPGGRQRLDAIYRGVIVPTVEPSSLGEDGLPHSVDGVIHSVEQNWLGAEGAKLVKRHIKDGVLTLERPNLQLSVRAMTPEGKTCPIVWGVSVERENGEDIVEPHLLVPEGQEAAIIIKGPPSQRLALLGVYDEESPQPGMPPIRKPLLEENGRVEMYVGGEAGNNQVVFWKEGKWGYLRVVTPVKSVGGDLSTIEEGAPEVALHGGLYLITIPEKTPPPLPDVKSILPDYYGGLKGGDLFSYGGTRGGITKGGGMYGDTLKGGVTAEGDDLLGGLLGGRAGGLTQGELRGRGGRTEFNPNTEDIMPFIIRVRATGEYPSYLQASTIAINTESSIVVKSAICDHCGVTAPKESYEWVANEFRTDEFECGRCGGGTIEPVTYRKRVQKN